MSFTFSFLNVAALTHQEQGSIENSSRESMDEMEMDDDENQPQLPSHHLQCNQNQSPTETDDGTIDNDRVEYAVLLPDSFAVLDSTFNQHSL
jgi:hypothetical protein